MEPNTGRAIVELANVKPRTTLRELYISLREAGSDISEEDFLNAINSLVRDDDIALEDDISPETSFSSYLARWELNVSLYAILMVCVLTLLAVYFLPEQFPLVAARWLLGSALVVLLPGYVSIEALFPKREIDDLERLALSLGLSVAIVALIALVLNYTPWAIRLNSIVSAIVGYCVTIGVTAKWRKFKILNAKSELTIQ